MAGDNKQNSESSATSPAPQTEPLGGLAINVPPALRAANAKTAAATQRAHAKPEAAGAGREGVPSEPASRRSSLSELFT